MTPNRRSFLKSSLAASSLLSWSLDVPGFLGRTAQAAPNSGSPGGKDTILVVIQLTGGNDGLNTVVPFADVHYAKLRPTLKIASSELKKVNDSLGLHPSLDGLAGLLNDQALCIVQGVGYPNPSQSHFRSMDVWQAASTDETLTEGWLGKALKAKPTAPAFHLAAQNEIAPLAFGGAPFRVPSIKSLEDFQLRTGALDQVDRKEQRALLTGSTPSTPATGTPNLLDFVQRTAVNTYDSSQRLQEIGKNYQPKVPYPNSPLANRLKLAAQLIDADLGTRILYVAHENYDTHAGQANAHADLLRQLSSAMTAFYKDLAARGHQDRVLLMTFSEFGRRAKENGSKGTDHGAAAPLFLVGNRVRAGVVGAHPSLTDLDLGNLKHHTDFRQVYAAILDQWLGVSSKDVLGAGFAALPILKA